ncbi:MAG: hydantoinase B/oxoprolinase family protein [Alphaproteobacteria bacterium]|jgi:N-methylhydantoinase B/oxoprolinase/acetone carboxylase alpha subunit|nr:hydantoinase B/oxoprolinase family protein [Alphaproteobacteria bacterium]
MNDMVDAGEGLDPITVEVVRHKIEGIADEMEETLLRSSFSPIVKEGLDASASLFLADGTTLAQATAIPIHLATLIPAVATMIERFPVETMRPGDLYLLNDPYSGGTHLPDLAVAMPVFHGDRVIALSATMTHHQDVGGMTPGSVPTNATEVFQEGIRIPAVKLRDGETFDETLLAMLQLNVRMPDVFMGDLNAQIAACTVGARRLAETAEVYGGNELAAIFANLIERSEAMTRAALAALPEGRYRYVNYLDNDGIDLETPIRIEVEANIADGAVHFDFTGSSPQVKGPLNCVPSGTQAAAFYAVRAVTDPEIPTNGGCFRPVSLTLPEGSIVNPKAPAPVNARTATIKAITNCILGALAQAAPDRMPAMNCGALLVLAFGGQHDDGESFIVGDLIAGGSGASAGLDGVDVIETDASNCMNLPAEALEMEAPIRLLACRLRPDSGGPGRYRGGLGVVREYEILTDGIRLSHRGERHTRAADGLAGGGPGAMAHSVILRADGAEEVIASKCVTTLNRGDRLLVETAGGGGHGPAAERDPAARAADVADGKVGGAAQ